MCRDCSEGTLFWEVQCSCQSVSNVRQCLRQWQPCDAGMFGKNIARSPSVQLCQMMSNESKTCCNLTCTASSHGWPRFLAFLCISATFCWLLVHHARGCRDTWTDRIDLGLTLLRTLPLRTPRGVVPIVPQPWEPWRVCKAQPLFFLQRVGTKKKQTTHYANLWWTTRVITKKWFWPCQIGTIFPIFSAK